MKLWSRQKNYCIANKKKLIQEEQNKTVFPENTVEMISEKEQMK